MRTIIKFSIYLLIFPLVYYIITTVISVSKKNEIELTFIYSTEKTLNNKNLFIDDYMEGRAFSQFEPIHYSAIQVHEILSTVGLIKQDIIYHDATFKCLSNVDVRKIEMHNVSPTLLSLKYTFNKDDNEEETIENIIKCNNENLIANIGKYLAPQNVMSHKKRLETLIEYLPSISIGAQEEINAEYLIQPTAELVEEIRNLEWIENLFENNKDEVFKNKIKEIIIDSKMKILMDLKKIETNNKLNIYEKANSFDGWLKENQIIKTNAVIKLLNNSDLNIYEISKEIYRTENIKIDNTYSLYIFTILIGALIIVLIENLQRSFGKRGN